jgi:hypothetical protein
LCAVLIDCETCLAPADACHDCVVSAILGRQPPEPIELDEAEQAAIGNLAYAGLVPPLRLMPGLPGSSREIA